MHGDWHVDVMGVPLTPNPLEWSYCESAILFGVAMLWYHVIFDPLLTAIGANVGRIPGKGKHYDNLSQLDWAFIHFNWLSTPMFMFHLYRRVWTSCPWALQDMTLFNTLAALPLLFITYDLIYCLFHRALHIRGLYGLVHKHHHKQNVPTRGNVDAVNVHPFEFLCGEYLHLLCIIIVPCHALTVLAFLLVGGVLASLNHTRYDVVVRLPGGIAAYAVRAHDIHHHLNTANYGQYIMLWDSLWGSYREEEFAKKAA